MAIGTVNAAGEVRTRVVLCKDWSSDGFTFFTNYSSRKGRDLADHPRLGAVFYWDPMARQILISGHVQRVPRSESEAYWRTRPRESQISGYLSKQSEPVDSRKTLEDLWQKTEIEFKDREIPCPENWGGYRIVPDRIEFWLGQPGRLHDRYLFEKSHGGWTFCRLYP